MLLLIWLVVILYALVSYLVDVYSRLSKQQIRHLPVVPLLGNNARVAFRLEHMTVNIQKSYNEFPEDRLVGHYEFVNPLILIRDPDLLKAVTVKDFDHFVDRRAVGNVEDPVFARNLLLLKGDEWKAMRSTLSPAFTSSKIRLMVPFMLEVGNKMIENIKKKFNNSTEYIDVDVKDLSTRYANDVIATCAFGLKVNSQGQENEFYNNAKMVTSNDFRRFLKFIGFRSFPGLMKKLHLKVIPEKVAEFFSAIVLGTMKQREMNNIIRDDMIHLLMEAQKGKLSHNHSTADVPAGFATVEESHLGKENVNQEWSDSDLVGQAVLFLLSGLETVSTTISFLLHELALYPDVQQRLIEEIREYDATNGGKVDFNSIQDLVYLDMVVSEILRMWPPGPLVDRLCVKDYNAGLPNKDATKELIVKKGETLSIPIYSFHRDPQYFPKPNKFDPERFSEENRANIKPFTYLPFGLGPRNCIGSRFALCEVKVMVYQLLRVVEVSPSSRTLLSSQLAKNTPSMRLEGGHWLRFRLRSE